MSTSRNHAYSSRTGSKKHHHHKRRRSHQPDFLDFLAYTACASPAEKRRIDHVRRKRRERRNSSPDYLDSDSDPFLGRIGRAYSDPLPAAFDFIHPAPSVDDFASIERARRRAERKEKKRAEKEARKRKERKQREKWEQAEKEKREKAEQQKRERTEKEWRDKVEKEKRQRIEQEKREKAERKAEKKKKERHQREMEEQIKREERRKKKKKEKEEGGGFFGDGGFFGLFKGSKSKLDAASTPRSRPVSVDIPSNIYAGFQTPPSEHTPSRRAGTEILRSEHTPSSRTGTATLRSEHTSSSRTSVRDSRFEQITLSRRTSIQAPCSEQITPSRRTSIQAPRSEQTPSPRISIQAPRSEQITPSRRTSIQAPRSEQTPSPRTGTETLRSVHAPSRLASEAGSQDTVWPAARRRPQEPRQSPRSRVLAQESGRAREMEREEEEAVSGHSTQWPEVANQQPAQRRRVILPPGSSFNTGRTTSSYSEYREPTIALDSDSEDSIAPEDSISSVGVRRNRAQRAQSSRRRWFGPESS